MNKLILFENIGMNVTWKLIWIGLYGYEKITPQLQREDVIEYLYELLQHINNPDNIISIICQCEDTYEFDRTINNYASNDNSNLTFQVRKWRAYLLKELLDSISPDYMQGLLSLMEYWTYIGNEKNCPQQFPIPNDEMSIQDYFTHSTYEIIIQKNRVWLENELNIIRKNQSGTQGDGSSVSDNSLKN